MPLGHTVKETLFKHIFKDCQNYGYSGKIPFGQTAQPPPSHTHKLKRLDFISKYFFFYLGAKN